MTTQKTLKRRVRARAVRTGESYTAARAQVLRNVMAPAPDAIALTGMTDDALRRGSGKIGTNRHRASSSSLRRRAMGGPRSR